MKLFQFYAKMTGDGAGHSDFIMKFFVLFFGVLAMAAVGADGEGREYASKTVSLEFESVDQGRAWSLEGLEFGEWLKTVSDPGWIELHKSMNERFYFAIYRSGDHLIVCKNDRKKAFNGGSIQVRSSDAKTGYEVKEGPSKWYTLKWEVSYSEGGFSGQEVFDCFKILAGYSGPIEVEQRVKKDDGVDELVLSAVVSWKR
jgi:hypothetical protein